MPKDKNWNLKNSQYAWLLQWGFSLKAGEAHKAVRYVDYQCMPHSFAGVVYHAARTRGLRATTAVFPQLGVVVFCFYKPDALMRPNLAAYPVVRSLRGEDQRA